jgi:signal peptidase I
MRVRVTVATTIILAGCGGGHGASQEDAVRDTVGSYVEAAATHDGERFCGLLSGRALADAEAAGACAVDGPGGEAAEQDVDVGAVQVDGDRASAVLAQDRSVVAVRLIRDGEDWRIDEVRARRLEYGVSSDAMRPTYDEGERLVVNADAYAAKPVRRGDVVVFQAPAAQGCPNARAGLGYTRMCDAVIRKFTDVRFLKRVVAIAGDRLALRGGQLLVNGEPEDDAAFAPCDDPTLCMFPETIVVPPKSVYVLGDNRGASEDSRVFGPVPLVAVQGQVES